MNANVSQFIEGLAGQNFEVTDNVIVVNEHTHTQITCKITMDFTLSHDTIIQLK